MVEHPIEEPDEWTVSTDDAGVATLTLRNEKGALTDRGLLELRDLLEHLVEAPDVTVIVLTGTGEVFCVGMDVGVFADLCERTSDDEAQRRRRIRELVRRFHASILTMRAAPQPVVAGVNGTAAGGGFSLALAADYVIASADASFTHAYTDIGATADGGSTYYLAHLVGLQRAKELVFAPQPRSPGAMAELGVVNEVVDGDLEGTLEDRAHDLAGRPSEAIARTKRLLNGALDSTLETQLEREREAMAEAATTREFERRVTQFVRRR